MFINIFKTVNKELQIVKLPLRDNIRYMNTIVTILFNNWKLNYIFVIYSRMNAYDT